VLGVDVSEGGAMAQIFLSYSRADRQFVDELVPLLRRVYGNDSIWFDDEIHGGAAWWKLILSEIAQSELFIYLISNDSLESPYCQAEFREALRLRKQVLPIIARPKTEYPDRATDDLKPFLRDIQYVDMTRGFKDSTAGAQLYASINKLLAQVPSHPRLPPTETESVPEPDVSDKSSKHISRLTEPWAIIIAAILTGFFTIIAAYIGLSGRDGNDNKSLGEDDVTRTHIAAWTTQTETLQIPAPNPTNTPAGTPTPAEEPVHPAAERPTGTSPVSGLSTLTIQRSADTVAICANQFADLSGLKAQFGPTEWYILGEEFPASETTAAGQCWCLQQKDPVFPVPDVCTDENTSVQNRTYDWRNSAINLFLQDADLGRCEAQRDNRDIYFCEFD
jgi:hypothetical protein